MTYKHTMTIHKPWPHVGSMGGTFSNLITKLKNAVRNEIPIGYQDELGFHIGVEPPRKEIK
jgi:hypothetical protein